MGDVSTVAVALLILGVVALIIRGQFQSVIIYEWDAGLLYENGRFKAVLPPGRHWLFRSFRKSEVITVRILDQYGVTGAVDVTSAEKLPFRISAWFLYKVSDPRHFHERLGMADLSRVVAAALVEVAATRKLEELLAGRSDANARLVELAAPNFTDCELIQARIDTIQLPPETRRLFIEIEKARLEGMAALERARGEHAALRSLANAARLLKDNPELLNLRLLQSVAGAPKRSTTIVLGQSGLSVPATQAGSGTRED